MPMHDVNEFFSLRTKERIAPLDLLNYSRSPDSVLEVWNS